MTIQEITSKASKSLRERNMTPPKLRGGGNPNFGPLMEYIERRIDGVMEFYTNYRSEAVMCPELRTTINRELEPILRDAERVFNLDPMGLVLRVRTTEDKGILKVRAEKINLC